MSNFYCEHCGTAICDSPSGYTTFCEHYPKENKKTKLCKCGHEKKHYWDNGCKLKYSSLNCPCEVFYPIEESSTIEELERMAESEEWGGWKIVSEMLDSGSKDGIYSTSECYKKLYDFVVAQKEKVRHELEFKFGKEYAKAVKHLEHFVEETLKERSRSDKLVEALEKIVDVGGNELHSARDYEIANQALSEHKESQK